jgi:hypothetical protein
MAITNAKKPQMLVDQLGNEFSLDFKDVSFSSIRGGSIGIPEGMTLSEAIWWMMLKQRDLETEVAINERIEGFPIDVAHALQLAVMDLFGIRELRSTPGFFGDTPPTFITVPTDARGGVTEVFLGRFGVPGAEGFLETSRDFNDALWIRGKIRQKSLPVLKTLLKRTKELLVASSLYKGKAFRVGMELETEGFDQKVTMTNPEFMDVTSMPADLMLNRDTWDLLTAGLWTPIERSAQTRFYSNSAKRALKRGVLLYGPYGTGKSLTALFTAGKAESNGWTFIYLKDVKDLKRVYPFAARYAPSVIFAEDIDLVVKHGEDNNEDGINMLNNVLDGVDSKDKDVVLVLTTNHIEQLPASMLRPGRFDALVEYTLPDKDTAAKLVLQYGGGEIDMDNFDPEYVGQILEGNQPATIHEVIRRAKLYSQNRYDAQYRGPLLVSTRDIDLSHKSMENHMKLLHKPVEKVPSPMEQFGNVVGRYMVQGVNRAADEKLHPLSETLIKSMEAKATRPADRNVVGVNSDH